MSPEGKTYLNSEIDLIDYYKTLMQRKMTIVSIIFICIAIGMAISWLRPEHYVVSTTFEPPIIGYNKYFSPDTMADKIAHWAYDAPIIKSLNLPPDTSFDFMIKIKEMNVVVSLKSLQKDIDWKKKILDELFLALKEEYSGPSIEKTAEIEMQLVNSKEKLKSLKSKQSQLTKRIQNYQKKIALHNRKQAVLKTEIKQILGKKAVLSKEREATESVIEKLVAAVSEKDKKLDAVMIEDYYPAILLGKIFTQMLDDDLTSAEIRRENIEGFELEELYRDTEEINVSIEGLISERDDILPLSIQGVENALKQIEREKEAIRNVIQVLPPKAVKLERESNLWFWGIVGLCIGIAVVSLRKFLFENDTKYPEN